MWDSHVVVFDCFMKAVNICGGRLDGESKYMQRCCERQSVPISASVPIRDYFWVHWKFERRWRISLQNLLFCLLSLLCYSLLTVIAAKLHIIQSSPMSTTEQAKGLLFPTSPLDTVRTIYGLFATLPVRPLDVSPPRRFATWTIRPHTMVYSHRK